MQSVDRKGGLMTMRHRMRLLTAGLLAGLLLVLSTSAVMALGVGDKAPDFSLPATTAKEVGLGDFLGKKNVVVLF